MDGLPVLVRPQPHGVVLADTATNMRVWLVRPYYFFVASGAGALIINGDPAARRKHRAVGVLGLDWLYAYHFSASRDGNFIPHLRASWAIWFAR